MQRILVTGSRGFIGTVLCKALSDKGYTVIRLVRTKSAKVEAEIFWDPLAACLDQGDLENIDAVIHLGGKNVASGRWTQSLKNKIQQSRVISTRLLTQKILKLSTPPKVFICASGIGFYGTNKGKEYTEENPAGIGFLAETCVKWESETQPLEARGIRVVRIRFGLVLGKNGGALSMMLPFFKFGFGGVIGNGQQIMSWISINDVSEIIDSIVQNPRFQGPVNAVTPFPVSNREFTKTLGHLIKRPTFFNVPGFAVRLALGEMGEEMLLASSRVIPQKLLDHGYTFKYPHLELALKDLLNR